MDARGRFSLTPVAQELRRRRVISSLTDAQWRYLLSQKDILHTRRQWPVGARVAVEPRLPDWLGRAKLSLHTETEPDPPRIKQFVPSTAQGLHVVHGFWLQRVEAGAPAYPVICEITWAASSPRPRQPNIPRNERSRQSWSGTVNLPIEIVPAVSHVLVPVDSAEATEALRRSLGLRFRRDETGEARTGGITRSLHAADRSVLEQTAIGLRMEFSYRGEIMFTSRVLAEEWVCILHEHSFHPYFSQDLVDQYAPSMIAEPDQWSVLIEGDGELALASLSKTHRWAGILQMPLAELLRVETEASASEQRAKASRTDGLGYLPPPEVPEPQRPQGIVDIP